LQMVFYFSYLLFWVYTNLFKNILTDILKSRSATAGLSSLVRRSLSVSNFSQQTQLER